MDKDGSKTYRKLKAPMVNPRNANNFVAHQEATARHLEHLKAINEAKALLSTLKHTPQLSASELSKALEGKIKDWEKELRKVKISLGLWIGPCFHTFSFQELKEPENSPRRTWHRGTSAWSFHKRHRY
jgi:hypothetical protein